MLGTYYSLASENVGSSGEKEKTKTLNHITSQGEMLPRWLSGKPTGEDSPGEGNATHSSVLTWRIPWTEEPGGLQSTGLQRVGHDWACTHREKYKIRSLGDFHLVISPTNYN